MSVTVRKLDIAVDEDLYRQVYDWDINYPRWYREMDTVFRPSLESFLASAQDADQADVGVWNDDQFIALLSFVEHLPGRLEINLWAKRGACTEAIAWSAHNAIQGLIQNGAREIVAWLSKRNTPVKKLCIMAQLKPDGMRMWRKGTRETLEWHRYSLRSGNDLLRC